MRSHATFKTTPAAEPWGPELDYKGLRTEWAVRRWEDKKRKQLTIAMGDEEHVRIQVTCLYTERKWLTESEIEDVVVGQ